MSRMSEIAIDRANDLVEIARLSNELNTACKGFVDKYQKLEISNNTQSSQLEEATSGCLNINVGVVRFIEVCPKQLVVKF